jgi:importin-5
VLFRRIAAKTRKTADDSDLNELFLSLGQEQRAAIRQKLLACFPNEQLPHVRNKIGDAIAELGRQYTDTSTFGALT